MRLKVDTDLYACYFPQERPLDGTPVRVWNEDGKLLGDGVGIHLRQSGGAILVAGKTYDSNKIVHWLPLASLQQEAL
ncbi:MULTISPECIES: hypothetical protein [unclassified Cedecea]|uniref:hypothetical protein n=1 Tax=unclassified Cedecea TaxID=2649846 RepID=UPI003019743B